MQQVPTILILEDDEKARFVLSSLLTLAGYRVVEAERAAGALFSDQIREPSRENRRVNKGETRFGATCFRFGSGSRQPDPPYHRRCDRSWKD